MIAKTWLTQQSGGFIDNQIVRTLEHKRTSSKPRKLLSKSVKA